MYASPGLWTKKACSKKKSDKAIKHWTQAQNYVQQKNVLRKNLIKP